MACCALSSRISMKLWYFWTFMILLVLLNFNTFKSKFDIALQMWHEQMWCHPYTRTRWLWSQDYCALSSKKLDEWIDWTWILLNTDILHRIIYFVLHSNWKPFTCCLYSVHLPWSSHFTFGNETLGFQRFWRFWMFSLDQHSNMKTDVNPTWLGDDWCVLLESIKIFCCIVSSLQSSYQSSLPLRFIKYLAMPSDEQNGAI